LLTAAWVVGQINRTAPRTAAASLPIVMVAGDATYRVALPEGWRPVVQPMLEYGLVFGTQRESFAVGMEQVFMNAAMLRSQLPGYSAILPHAQLVLKSRLLAPPLGPLEVVTRLLPQIAGGPRGAIQNLRVLRVFPAREEFGFRQMLVVYQYTFLPQRDPAFASQAHPALRSEAQVPMQAAAYIVTFPYLPGQFSWQFGYRILSAPQNVFQRNAPTYAQILQTFRVIPEGLRQKIKSNQDMAKLCASMNQTTQQMAQNWGSNLGAGGELAGGDSQPPSVGPSPAKGDSRPAQASCGFGAPPLTCPDAKLCCHSASGPDHYRCVEKSKALPAVVETSEERGCTLVQ
jgi:hypothetical protein